MRRTAVLLLLAACSDAKPLDPQVRILLSQDPVKAPAALAALARRQGLPAGAVLHFSAEGADITPSRLTAVQMGDRVLVTVSHGRAVRLVLTDLAGNIVDRAGVAAHRGDLTPGLTVTGGKGDWTIFEFRGEPRLYRRAVTVQLAIRDGQFAIAQPALTEADLVLDEPWLPLTSLPSDPAKGPYAGRFAKQPDSRASRALQRALERLGREWPTRGTWDIAARGHTLGVQALAILAFLRSGFTPISTDEFSGLRAGSIVRGGLRGLIDSQEADGCIADRSVRTYLNSHIIATLALCEAWTITGLPEYREPAKRATGFLVAAQNPGAGFHDSARSGVSDSSCTGLAFLALRAAQIAGFDVPKSSWHGMLAWMESATDADGRTGYLGAGGYNTNTAYDPHETLSAAADLVREHAGVKRRATALILRDRPEWTPRKVDSSYWLFGVEVVTDPEWRAAMERTLLTGQNADGSWVPDQWAGAGAAACATAMNAMVLARLVIPP